MKIDEILKIAVRNNASDVILTFNRKVIFKTEGRLEALASGFIFTDRKLEENILPLLELKNLKEEFFQRKEIDFSYELKGFARFRVNCFWQQGHLGAVFRLIPEQIPAFEKLQLPSVIKSFVNYPKGLILVTGPTGSGKSTTLAALIQIINNTKPVHIITLEDPIEFIYPPARAVIEQREVGKDTLDFPSALRHVLRQAPDVVLIGEMRDLETISAAITMAETGHLVFATLHTTDAVQTVDRIIHAFPSEARSQIRIQLSMVLQAVLSQQLLPDITGTKRVVACEVMLVNNAIRSLVREKKTHQLYSVIQSSGGIGSRTMNQSLRELYEKGMISKETALNFSCYPEDLEKAISRIVPRRYIPKKQTSPFAKESKPFPLDREGKGKKTENKIIKEKAKIDKEKSAEDLKKDMLNIDFDFKI
jgi:twitching motility protein PilT